MEFIAGFILWVVLSAIAAAIADNKGRRGGAYFAAALLLSPLIGIIAALSVEHDQARIEHKALKKGIRRKCPQCAELIKPDAVVCRYCGNEFAPSPQSIYNSADHPQRGRYDFAPHGNSVDAHLRGHPD